MMCKKCGQKVKKTDKFCMNCGEKLNPQHTKEFLNKNQTISDIEVRDGVIFLEIYNSRGNSGFLTHKEVGIQKKKAIKELIMKSNNQKIPILLEKLGIEKEESGDFMEEIQKVATIIGDNIMCNKQNINIVKTILYENNKKYTEQKVNDTTIIYL